MKIKFENVDDYTIYRIYDFDIKYEKILQSCFYEKINNGYIKKYPRNSKYIKKMKKRYHKYAHTMFDQVGYFTNIPWKVGLKKFCSMVKDTTIDWWLTGSCASCIRGINLDPHDIDIMIDSKSTSIVTEIFKDFLIEPIVDTNGWLTKEFGVIFMDVRIDIASDPVASLDNPIPLDCGQYAKNNLEIIEWEGYKIKIPLLQLQLNANEKRGRLYRIKKISEFIKNKT